MGERVTLPFASWNLLAAARETAKRAHDRVMEGTTTPLGTEEVALFHPDSETVFRIADSKIAGIIYIERIILGFNGEPPEMKSLLQLPRGEVTHENTKHLGVLEENNPKLADELSTIAEELANAKTITPEQYQQVVTDVYTRPLTRSRMSDPLRAGFSLIAKSTKARLHKLNPLNI